MYVYGLNGQIMKPKQDCKSKWEVLKKHTPKESVPPHPLVLAWLYF